MSAATVNVSSGSDSAALTARVSVLDGRGDVALDERDTRHLATGGAVQTIIAFPERHSGRPGRAAWWAAAIQSAGTLFFNVTTYPGAPHIPVQLELQQTRVAPRCARLDLLSRLRRDRVPRRRAARLAARARPPGLVGTIRQLLGCIFFGISAIAGYLVPSTGNLLSLGAANWNTALGAACFLACALATLLTGRTHKSPRLRRLHKLQRAVERDVRRIT